jgi:two-component system, chemotaxis family, chemotaxis protein CheY
MSAKILVVDDSRPIRQEITTALTEAGYEVVEAEDGAQGLAAARARRDIALVICDINMPKMTGLEVLAALKGDASSASLPVVMLTTEGNIELIRQAKRLGAKGWVVKPFKTGQLVAVVRRMVGPPG